MPHNEGIVAGAAVDSVRAIARFNSIVACDSVQDVIPQSAVQLIAPRVANDRVVPVTADHCGYPSRAGQGECQHVRTNGLRGRAADVD